MNGNSSCIHKFIYSVDNYCCKPHPSPGSSDIPRVVLLKNHFPIFAPQEIVLFANVASYYKSSVTVLLVSNLEDT